MNSETSEVVLLAQQKRDEELKNWKVSEIAYILEDIARMEDDIKNARERINRIEVIKIRPRNGCVV